MACMSPAPRIGLSTYVATMAGESNPVSHYPDETGRGDRRRRRIAVHRRVDEAELSAVIGAGPRERAKARRIRVFWPCGVLGVPRSDGAVIRRRTTRWPMVVGALSLAALLGGCSGPTSNGPAMMGGSSSTRAGTMSGFSGGMMGTTPRGYHLSRLTCSAPSSLPGTTVYVMVGDMGMTAIMGGDAPRGQHMMLRAVPAQVPSGQVSFVVGNMGWRTHELVLLPLGPGQNEGERVAGADGRVDETGSLGEASASCAAGSGEGIKSGTVGWVTLNLPAGRYELLCNLRNHYANGMHQLLVVT